jgi:hypothetical protein
MLIEGVFLPFAMGNLGQFGMKGCCTWPGFGRNFEGLFNQLFAVHGHTSIR